MRKFINSISNKKKAFYLMWVSLNFLILMISGGLFEHNYGFNSYIRHSDDFFPFGNHFFRFSNYDYTEFLVYTLLPIVLLYINFLLRSDINNQISSKIISNKVGSRIKEIENKIQQVVDDSNCQIDIQMHSSEYYNTKTGKNEKRKRPFVELMVERELFDELNEIYLQSTDFAGSINNKFYGKELSLIFCEKKEIANQLRFLLYYSIPTLSENIDSSICTFCASDIPNESKFCSECGKKV